MENNIKSIIEKKVSDINSLYRGFINVDGFLFAALDNPRVFDALIVKTSKSENGLLRLEDSDKTLEEHIELINKFSLEKVKIIGDDFSFVEKCPTIKHFSILPYGVKSDNWDFSPFYELPEIKTVIMLSSPDGFFEKMKDKSGLNCSKVKGLENLSVVGNSCYNYQEVKTLKSISLFNVGIKDLLDFDLPNLKELSLTQCKLKTLDGIGKLTSLQKLDLSYDRALQNISELKELKTLRFLIVMSCPQIGDFGCLNFLTNLEYLSLVGNNEIESISFLKNLSKLRSLNLYFNVLDGDLSLCKNIQYVDVKNRKHYNFKDKDLPKNRNGLGFSVN